ncbi:MAG TPA: hypothetical protein DEB40_02055 [Elusimicrobia bacterium]|nr:hypothetical protein [Elusimicrobiota bacterium]
MEQKPQIPTLKDSKKPQVKIKGLAGGMSFMERLKQFKKKDLAFILAGLGVLIMAPLAEHFMMSPESADSGAFKPGWGFQPSGRFGSGDSPYERGVDGMAAGGAVGGGSDVITPLNVRDPSALIMGPGASQQPAATATAPTAPSKESTDWKDAIANAAGKGASAATRAARLPVPKPALTNAGLRGLGVAAGGGGSSYSLPGISAANVPNKAASSDSLSQVSRAPDYRGVGPRGSQNASAGAMEALKKAAANAGSDFNRQGPASSALESAASHQMPGGGYGDGMGGGGGRDDKGFGGNQDKGSKSMGESLEFLALKDEQQKARDLKWELKKKSALLWPNLKEKVLETMVTEPLKGIVGSVSEGIKNLGSDRNSYIYECKEGGKIAAGDVAGECTKDTKGFCLGPDGNIYSIVMAGGDAKPTQYKGCTKKKGNSEQKPNETEQNASGNVPGVANQGGPNYSGRSIEKVCQELKGNFGSSSPQVVKDLEGVTGLVASAYDALSGGKPAGTCGAQQIIQGAGGGTIKGYHDSVQDKLGGANGAVVMMNNALTYAAAATQGASAAIADEKTGKAKTVVDNLQPQAYNREEAIKAVKFGEELYKQAKDGAASAAAEEQKVKEPLDAADKWINEAGKYLNGGGNTQPNVAQALRAARATYSQKAAEVKSVQDTSKDSTAQSIYDDLGKLLTQQEADLKAAQARQTTLKESVDKGKAVAPKVAVVVQNTSAVAASSAANLKPVAEGETGPATDTMSLPAFRSAVETADVAGKPLPRAEDLSDPAKKLPAEARINEAKTEFDAKVKSVKTTLDYVSKQNKGDDGSYRGVYDQVQKVMAEGSAGSISAK